MRGCGVRCRLAVITRGHARVVKDARGGRPAGWRGLGPLPARVAPATSGAKLGHVAEFLAPGRVGAGLTPPAFCQEAYAEYLRSIQYISQVLLEQVDSSKGMATPSRPAAAVCTGP